MLQPVVRALIEAELPVLARHDVTMWGYVVLNALQDAPQSTQSALAEKIGADKTRIIATLDDLQAAGLISREPDPADRRSPAAVDPTPVAPASGGRCRTRSSATRERVLAELPPAERTAFLRAAGSTSALPVARILAGPPGGLRAGERPSESPAQGSVGRRRPKPGQPRHR